MANIFGIRRSDPPEDLVSIPDKGADALLDILVLAASALAETDAQRRLTVWLAEHDRNYGVGTVGFYLSDMPWDSDSFEEDRQFMVRVTDAASQKTGWEVLDYRPNADHLMPMLGWFRKGFVRLKTADINHGILSDWLSDMDDDDPVFHGFPRCKKHGVYLAWHGCRICNAK